MLPRAALHQENVISNEQVKRQRVEAGQIASNFLGQHMVYPCLCFCHYAFNYCNNYASLHIRRFLCEVACLSVK